MNPRVHSPRNAGLSNTAHMSSENSAGCDQATPGKHQTLETIGLLFEEMCKNSAALTKRCDGLEKLLALANQREEAFIFARLKDKQESEGQVTELTLQLHELTKTVKILQGKFENHKHLQTNDQSLPNTTYKPLPGSGSKNDPAFTAGPTYNFKEECIIGVFMHTQVHSPRNAVVPSTVHMSAEILAGYDQAPQGKQQTLETMGLIFEEICKNNAALTKRCEELEKQQASAHQREEAFTFARLKDKREREDQIGELTLQLNELTKTVKILQERFENHKHLKTNDQNPANNTYKPLAGAGSKNDPAFTAGPTYDFKEECIIS